MNPNDVEKGEVVGYANAGLAGQERVVPDSDLAWIEHDC